MRTILVTGGNGFVGRHLVTALAARGDRVRVLALPGEDARWLERSGIAVYRGDITQPESLAAPAEGADGVFHLAAMQDVWRPIDLYRAVNVGGTRNVARAALTAGARRFVHMSSSSVYGMGHRRPVDEAFPLMPFPDPYPVTKAEADRAVQQAIKQDGLPGVIIRPDQIFGPGDLLHFGAMAERALTGRCFLVGRGDNRMPFVYVDDVVRALLLALDHDAAPGNAYNVSSDSPFTQRQMLSAIAEDTGGSPPGPSIPYRALYAAGYLAERLAGALSPGRRPPVTRLGVAFFGTDNQYAIDKARAELGYQPTVGLRDGVRMTAEWYLEHRCHGSQEGERTASARPDSQAAREAAERATI
jgi:nucleoside-diphosphate-sugar epimerase